MINNNLVIIILVVALLIFGYYSIYNKEPYLSSKAEILHSPDTSESTNREVENIQPPDASQSIPSNQMNDYSGEYETKLGYLSQELQPEPQGHNLAFGVGPGLYGSGRFTSEMFGN